MAANSGVGVQAGADGGAAEWDLPEAGERILHARDALAHLRRIAPELLAERDGDGVHPVGATRLDHVVELRGLRLERACERLHRRQQVVDGPVERREVHGGREDVVRRLAHVDVVVRVHALAGEVRDHLVRVHVRARPGAGLEDVDRELVVELACRDAIAGGGDALCHLRIEQAQIRVRAGGRGLDPAEPVRDGGGNGLTRDGEVGHGLVGLGPPQLLRAHCSSLASSQGQASASPRQPRQAIPIDPASSRAIACSPLPVLTVSGPSNGAEPVSSSASPGTRAIPAR